MSVSTQLPTLYEYYTGNGVQSGLDASKPYFTLNDKNITIYSGACHYFRVPRAHWRDRLRKMRAAGLNAVETYVPWNLHEPEPGRFDFGRGGSDMEDFLHVAEFLKIAKEEDLLAIVRSGPYICSEWEFGGFPSWLLKDRNVKVRTSESSYMQYVTRYFNVLLPILAMLQFTKGGPIVAFQVENEYGSTYEAGKFTPDKSYLRQLRNLMIRNGIVELLVTSDSATMHGSIGTLPGVFLQTTNFASDPEAEFRKLEQLQPGKPVMAMEFWGGWFDHWSENHHTTGDDDFSDVYERILKYPASVNMYMFHGGTNWGFMNGANLANGLTDNSGYQPDTTSYDYDAPLAENGDYTVKYVLVKSLIRRYNNVSTRLPQTPHLVPRVAYQPTPIDSQLLLDELIDNTATAFSSNVVVPMEFLPINNQSGQSYGYVVYRKRYIDIPANSVLTIRGRVCDTVTVLINGKLVSKPLMTTSDLNGFGTWKVKNSNLTLGSKNVYSATLDLLVENWGRNGFGYVDQFNQYKGLWQGGVYLNDNQIFDWRIIPLEFKKKWNSNLVGWHSPLLSQSGPSLFKTSFYVRHEPVDTYVDMQDWTKGIVIVNDFVLGRYSRIGPQQTLYLPGPFLRKGWNEIMVFEHYIPSDFVRFSNRSIYLTRVGKKSYN